jgi:CHAD domain-containing protein
MHLTKKMSVATKTTSTKKATEARIQPIQVLEDQIVALDAAMLVAVTSTEVGAVHKLRTTTRRVQAHLSLLDLLNHGDHPVNVPVHQDEIREVMQHLRRIRRAAGAVRDLDVQTSMIALDAPEKATVHKGTPGDEVRKQAKKLRKQLEAQRDVEAQKLVATLKDEEQDLAVSLRALEQAIKPAKRRTLSHAVLLEHAEEFFAGYVRPVLHLRKASKEDERQAVQRRIDQLDEDALHSLRKAAKLCRYMVEMAPEGSKARVAAARFEAVQEAGGHWHDWLLLQQLSEDFHGRKAELTQRYAKHAMAALADYRLKLTEVVPTFKQ